MPFKKEKFIDLEYSKPEPLQLHLNSIIKEYYPDQRKLFGWNDCHEILKNALGSITLKNKAKQLGEPKEKYQLKIVSVIDEGKLVIKIKDAGVGFLTESKSTFFTVKDVGRRSVKDWQYGGAGIGLTDFCQEVEHWMGGKLLLKNRKNGGGAVLQITFKHESIKSHSEGAEEKNFSDQQPHMSKV